VCHIFDEAVACQLLYLQPCGEGVLPGSADALPAGWAAWIRVEAKRHGTEDQDDNRACEAGCSSGRPVLSSPRPHRQSCIRCKKRFSLCSCRRRLLGAVKAAQHVSRVQSEVEHDVAEPGCRTPTPAARPHDVAEPGCRTPTPAARPVYSPTPPLPVELVNAVVQSTRPPDEPSGEAEGSQAVEGAERAAGSEERMESGVEEQVQAEQERELAATPVLIEGRAGLTAAGSEQARDAAHASPLGQGRGRCGHDADAVRGESSASGGSGVNETGISRDTPVLARDPGPDGGLGEACDGGGGGEADQGTPIPERDVERGSLQEEYDQDNFRVDTPILPRNAGARDAAGDAQAAGDAKTAGDAQAEGSRGKSPAPVGQGARDKAAAMLAAHSHNQSVVEGEATENESTSSVHMCVALPDGRLLQVPATAKAVFSVLLDPLVAEYPVSVLQRVHRYHACVCGAAGGCAKWRRGSGAIF